MPPRIAVTGLQGQVVSALRERALAHGVEIVALGRPALDLTDAASVRRALAAAAPAAIVNAAAYTAVDRAEQEEALAFAVNATGAGHVAEAARALQVPLIQLSTDYVFDGAGALPYREDDRACPLGAYGRSKLAGEAAVAAATPDFVVLRTAWVYSPFGTNFLKTMLRLADSRAAVSVVADQLGAPTSALDIADAVIAVAGNLLARPNEAALRGIFHMTAQGETHWAGFAEAIFAASAAVGGPFAQVRPIASAQYPTPARRPANSRLDCARLAGAHGIALPPWRAPVAACVERVLRSC